MKIKVSQIPEEGQAIQKDIPFGDKAKATIDLSLSRLAGQVFIAGSASTTLSLQCSRCLNDFTEDLSVELNLAYMPQDDEEDGEPAHEHELLADEIQTGFFIDGELDLTQIVSEQLVLNSPMKPLCGEGCKGLCSVCGIDLNEHECSCEKGNIDPRLQVLKEYLNKKKE
jgi:uncharacterized protein